MRRLDSGQGPFFPGLIPRIELERDGMVFQMYPCKPVTVSVQWLWYEMSGMDLNIQIAITD